MLLNAGTVPAATSAVASYFEVADMRLIMNGPRGALNLPPDAGRE